MGYGGQSGRQNFGEAASRNANLFLGKKPLRAKYTEVTSDEEFKPDIEPLVESSEEPEGFGLDSDEELLLAFEQTRQ